MEEMPNTIHPSGKTVGLRNDPKRPSPAGRHSDTAGWLVNNILIFVAKPFSLEDTHV